MILFRENYLLFVHYYLSIKNIQKLRDNVPPQMRHPFESCVYKTSGVSSLG